MNESKVKTVRRERRKRHVRKHVTGTAERPRLSVHKTQLHTYAQVVDDAGGRTLASASTTSPAIRQTLGKTSNCAAAAAVGATIAALAIEKGIKKICFDRSAFRYHGRIKALAEAARKGGLQF
jgi:large subunit ribosomal protein L18